MNMDGYKYLAYFHSYFPIVIFFSLLHAYFCKIADH